MSLYRYERRSSPALLLFGITCVMAVVAALSVLQVSRALPNPSTSITLPETSVLGDPARPALPEVGASIVAVQGLGTLGQFGVEEPMPIASVAKVMTAYVLLQEHPLGLGEPGFSVEITQRDGDRFWEMAAQDQSVQPVNPGQVLTQLQLVQGMLIPSANNYAEIAAVWDAGSIEAYVDKMNAYAQSLGMSNTTYADVSGFSSQTVSTAGDQLRLLRAAMQDAVFAETVGMAQVELPVAGLVSNVNQLLGVGGVVGIKTGQTEEAGGNLAFAARREFGGATVEAIGMIMNQEDRQAAFDATVGVLNSLSNHLQLLRVVPAGQPVGTVNPPWGDPVDVVVAHDVTMMVWPGMTLETIVELDPVDPHGRAGELAGWLTVRVGEQEERVPLTLAVDIPDAGIGYRLTRF